MSPDNHGPAHRSNLRNCHDNENLVLKPDVDMLARAAGLDKALKSISGGVAIAEQSRRERA